MSIFHAVKSNGILRTTLPTPSMDLHCIHVYNVCPEKQKIRILVKNLWKTKSLEFMWQKHKSWISSLNLVCYVNTIHIKGVCGAQRQESDLNFQFWEVRKILEPKAEQEEVGQMRVSSLQL